jgi:Uma2 family endonuclease
LKLARLLAPLAEARGLEATYETGLYRPGTGESDYRVPDLMFARTEHISPRGVEGHAELVVELLSEDDESREKLAFYAEVGVREVMLIDPDTREFELYTLRDSRFFAAMPDEQGSIRSATLGVTLAKGPGPHLMLSWPEGSARI